MKNEEVLHRLREEGNIPHTVLIERRGKLDWSVTSCVAKCLQRHDVEETAHGTGRRGRRSKCYWMNCRKIEDTGN